MQSLTSVRVRRDVRALLRSPPRGLDALYDQAMCAINEQTPEDSSLAKRILSWVAYADRLLTVKEMQYLLAIDLNDEQLHSDAVPEEGILSAVCAGLILIEGPYRLNDPSAPNLSGNPNSQIQGDGILRFVHFTTQDYFLEHRERLFPGWAADSVKLCLQALKIEFKDSEENELQVVGQGLRSFPTYRLHPVSIPGSAFSEYSLQHLMSKKPLEGLADDIPAFAAGVLSVRSVAGRIIDHAHAKIRKLRTAQLDLAKGCEVGFQVLSLQSSLGTPVPHVAACLGFQETLRRSLVPLGPWSVDTKDTNGLTALTYASIFGTPAIIRMLLVMGASASLSTEVFDPLEVLVAVKGQSPLADVWLHPLNLSRERLERVLSVAVRYERKKTIATIIEQASRVYPEYHVEYTILCQAIQIGHAPLIHTILESDWVAKFRRASGENLLFDAVRANQASSVLALLQQGFDINSRNARGETPLFIAARENFLGLADELVNQGAALHIRCRKGYNAVHVLLASLLAGRVMLQRAASIEEKNSTTLDPSTLLLNSQNPFAMCKVNREGETSARKRSSAEENPLLDFTSCEQPTMFA